MGKHKLEPFDFFNGQSHRAKIKNIMRKGEGQIEIAVFDYQRRVDRANITQTAAIFKDPQLDFPSSSLPRAEGPIDKP